MEAENNTIKAEILWVDDEIDLLEVQILFLKSKGYSVTKAYNGNDAVELTKNNNFDIIFLDENMPGISGLETLRRIKSIKSEIPVVMITKNEGEDIMDEAVGSKISDYLIKPVNPNQILLSIKKNVENRRLVNQKTSEEYQSEFNKLGNEITLISNFEGWTNIYKKLVEWELKLAEINSPTMAEIFGYQKNEAGNAFCKYITKNYEKWIAGNRENRPIMQHDVFKERILPLLDKGEKVFWIVIDNLRFDQWKALQPLIAQYFNIDSEEIICSILPTATQYARNAMFSGLTPLQIQRNFPHLWTDEDERHSKNECEEELVKSMLKRFNREIKFFYRKTFNNNDGQKINAFFPQINNNKLNIAVYNFVDTMSHARTELPMMRELADDESAYRAITKTWFKHSALFDLMRTLAQSDYKIVFATDHGTVKVNNPIKVTGEKNITNNPRYKQGRDLQFNKKDVFCPNPQNIQLPTLNISSQFIFATGKDFMAYPNKYNYYVKYFKDTFQHGGVSMEEMLIPLVILSPKKTTSQP